MDEDGRGDRSPVTTLPGAGAPPGRMAVVAGRLDDWWDPAWDAAWWDPAWNADRPVDAPASVAAMGQLREADSAQPESPAAHPVVSPDHVAGPAVTVPLESAIAVPPVRVVAVPAGPAVVARTPPKAAPDPSWSQVLATTVSLWASRRRPQAGTRGAPDRGQGPDDARQRATGFRWPLRHPSGRRPRPTVRGRAAPGGPARRPRLSARGRAVPVRLLAASMLGAGLLAVGAGTAGLLTASGSPAAPVRWARPSPLPAPPGRTVAPALLATVQQPARPLWLSVPAIGMRTRLVDLGLNPNGTLQVPTSTTVAGWFTGSPRPGAVGPAVIAGHVDSRSGPAIFFWLRTLRPGDRIYVGRADGTLAVFTVTSVRMYRKDEFPTAAVYGSVPDPELRLITCGGIFDPSLGSYLSNVVVFARLT
jgi:Sortase domain